MQIQVAGPLSHPSLWLPLSYGVLSSPQCMHHLIYCCLEHLRSEVKRKRTGAGRVGSLFWTCWHPVCAANSSRTLSPALSIRQVCRCRGTDEGLGFFMSNCDSTPRHFWRQEQALTALCDGCFNIRRSCCEEQRWHVFVCTDVPSRAGHGDLF